MSQTLLYNLSTSFCKFPHSCSSLSNASILIVKVFIQQWKVSKVRIQASCSSYTWHALTHPSASLIDLRKRVSCSIQNEATLEREEKEGRAGQGKFWVAMGFIRNHLIHTLERHVSVSANLLSLISGISHILHSLQRFAIAIESIPTIMKRWKVYNGGHVCTLSPPQP